MKVGRGKESNSVMRGNQNHPEFSYKKLCTYTFKLHSPSEDVLFDAVHPSRRIVPQLKTVSELDVDAF